MASLRDPTAVLDPLRRSIIKRGLSILVCSGDVALSIGVDEMQRNFAGMRTQVEAWRQSQLSDVAAKLIIYRAFRRWEGASGINQKNSLASAPRRCRVGASGDRRKVPVLTNLVQEHCPKGP